MKKKIYLDHSATTPVDPAVAKAMQPYQTEIFGNASSIHSFGQVASQAVEKARQTVAKFLNCQPAEIYFTAGATEADNLVILGLAKPGDQIITSKIEHPAILEPAKELEKRGVAVTYIGVNKNGLVSVKDIQKAIKPQTVLVSMMYVNNEVGTIQPIAALGKIIAAENKKRKNKIYFHTDAVQAANYCELDTKKLGVDFLSLSGHKIYGPRGIGVLFVRKGVKISPIQFGGHQEAGLRPGTLNVPGIVGLGKAVEFLMASEKQAAENLKIKKLRDKLILGITKKIPGTAVNGDLKQRVPANANFCFKNVEGESILLLLDFEGIAVSTGSACSSGSLEPSHVLTAMGISPELVHGSLRITLGKNNTSSDVDEVIKVLPKIIQKLRKISPYH